ncbi:MAG: transporter [Spirosomataceae bacterium]
MKLYVACLLIVSGFTGVFAQTPKNVESTLEILDIQTGKRTVVLQEKRHFEAPNWHPTDHYLLINSNGLLEKVSLTGQQLGIIPTDFANQCNNDHLIAKNGKWIALSHNDPNAAKSPGGSSRIFTVPIAGGIPQLITPNNPSYLHGISPDGKTLAYCAMRGNNEWDIYTIATTGGEEKRLTTAPNLDDGPEYSPDGNYIYFNSHRTGRMHLYRMKADGTEQEQLTHDEFDNWFGHPSPDGKWLVYIAYLQDQQGKHPFGKDVKLRLMNLQTHEIKDLTSVFFGGQGTINVPSWSPDSKQIALVSYRLFE